MFAASRSSVVLLVFVCSACATCLGADASLESGPRPMSRSWMTMKSQEAQSLSAEPNRMAVQSSLLVAMAPPSGMSQLLAFPVTCFFFFFEALLHFHIGKTGQLGISLPNYDELFKIIVSIVICSGLSSGTVMLIESLWAKRRAALAH